jgi:tetratricopeptide (TPR) repeat protein
MLPLNPYVAGNPVGGHEAFVGRADILHAVTRILASPSANALVIYGQRRIGKTSILEHLARELPKTGPYRTVYFDLQDKAPLPLWAVVNELARKISLDLGGSPGADLPQGEAALARFKEDFLPRVFASLPQGHSLALLFDEFDVLDSPQENLAAVELFPYLRGLLTLDPARLQFVFVIGRNLDDLTNRALPLLKGLSVQRVSLLSRTATEQLVRLSERNDSLRWTPEAMDRVYHWTNGHPYLTQQLCWVVWETAYEADPAECPVISAGEVDAAIPQALGLSLAALEWLWDGLGPAERVVASALALAGQGTISKETLEEVLRESGVKVLIGELQNAPEILEKWDLLEENEGGYKFRVELLRQWLLERKPLAQVQDELDRIQPVADNLYQAARGLFRGGQLDDAARLLQQAIGINPNHVRASQLYAEIQIAHGEYEEAIKTLRRLYAQHPAAARPRLTQALASHAESLADPDAQAAAYEEILSLDNMHKEALLGLMLNWEKRGDRALAEGKTSDAIEAYGNIFRLAEPDASTTLADRWYGLMKKLAQALEDQARQQEAERKYILALETYYQLQTDFAILKKSWEADIDRLEKKSQLNVTYHRALRRIAAGRHEEALELLHQVVSVEPKYERAAYYLAQAVEGRFKLLDDDTPPSGTRVDTGELPHLDFDWRTQAKQPAAAESPAPRKISFSGWFINSAGLVWLPVILLLAGGEFARQSGPIAGEVFISQYLYLLAVLLWLLTGWLPGKTEMGNHVYSLTTFVTALLAQGSGWLVAGFTNTLIYYALDAAGMNPAFNGLSQGFAVFISLLILITGYKLAPAAHSPARIACLIAAPALAMAVAPYLIVSLDNWLHPVAMGMVALGGIPASGVLRDYRLILRARLTLLAGIFLPGLLGVLFYWGTWQPDSRFLTLAANLLAGFLLGLLSGGWLDRWQPSPRGRAALLWAALFLIACLLFYIAYGWRLFTLNPFYHLFNWLS